MGASTLHRLTVTAVLALGVALVPALGAAAAPVGAVVAWSASATDQDVAASTAREAVLDDTAQHMGDSDGLALVDATAEPPVWLLGLLVPILLGGAVGVGVTLRRLQ